MSGEPLLDLIDRIYAAALDPEAWPAALDALAQAVGGLGAVIVPVTAPERMVSIASPALIEPNRAYESHWWRHDTRIAYFRSQRIAPGVVTDSSVFSDDQVRRDPFYQEFLRPNGFGACMAHIASPSPNVAVAVSVQRDRRRGGFDSAELERFGIVAPHVARALTTTARLAQADRTARLLDTAMEHASCGMVALDASGRVVHLNATAEGLLGDGLGLRDGRLQARLPEDQSRLDALVQAALRGDGRDLVVDTLATVAIRRRARPLPLLVQAIPVRSPPQETAWEPALLGPGALILLHDPARPPGHGTVDRFVLLGLTPGQARVADLVGQGFSVGEAAVQLGLAESTVRVVLKAVYDRLGLSRQSQLAVLATRLRSMND